MRIIYENNHIPEPGKYKNAVVEDGDAEKIWLYDACGTYSLIDGGYTASQIANVPAGNISSTNVQDAINELDAEKSNRTDTVLRFTNIAALKAANLPAGYVAVTEGYYTSGDGGSGTYTIVNDNTLVEDNGLVHNAANGLKIKLMYDGTINIKQLGAKSDGVFDNTTILNNAIYRAENNVTIVLPRGVYLTNRLNTTGNHVGRKNFKLIGEGSPVIKLNQSAATPTIQGSYALPYTISEGIGEINFASTCTVGTITTEMGRKYYYLSTTDKTLIPSYLAPEMVLKGKTSQTKATVASIDTADPDGVGSARIYLYETYNFDKKLLNFTTASNILGEVLVIKPQFNDDFAYMSFADNTVPAYMTVNRQVKQSDGSVGRINKIGLVYNTVNYVELNCFKSSFYETLYTENHPPMASNLPFDVISYANIQSGLMSLHKFIDVEISGIVFDGSANDIGRFESNANSWNTIYTYASKNVNINKCTFKHSVMAGIHIGGAGNAFSTTFHDFPENVTLKDCHFYNNGRNDAEIIHGVNITVENCEGDGSLDVETNGNELLEVINISNSKFHSTDPYSPGAINGSSIVNYTNCWFRHITVQVGVMIKLNNVAVHSLRPYNGAVVTGVNCTVNRIDGNYGNEYLEFSNSNFLGLTTTNPASQFGNSKWRFNNCTIDLGLIRKLTMYDNKLIELTDSYFVSSSTFVADTAGVRNIYNCNNTVFRNIRLFNATANATASRFFGCQFLLADTAVQLAMITGSFSARFTGCFIQASLTTTGQLTFINCIMSSASSPRVGANNGIYVNGMKADVKAGITWSWVQTGGNTTEDQKVLFTDVHLSKTVPGIMGITNGLTPVNTTSVSDKCKCVWVDGGTSYGARLYYNSTTLTSVDLVSETMPTGGTAGQFLKKNSSTNYDSSFATLTKADAGLANVDNTSDANKPVSTAQQTALDLKAPLASPALTGTPTAPTAAAATNNTQVATTAYADASSAAASIAAVAADMIHALKSGDTFTGPVVMQGATSTAANNSNTGTLFTTRDTSGNERIDIRARGNSAGIGGSNFPMQVLITGGGGGEIYTLSSAPLTLGTSSNARVRIDGNGAINVLSYLVNNVVTVTADSTIATTTKMLRVNSASPTNQTLPTPTLGVEYVIKNRGAGLVTLIGTIDGGTTNTVAQNKAVRLMGNGTDFDLIGGVV